MGIDFTIRNRYNGANVEKRWLNMADILQGLNPAQREAVTTTAGFVRVIAGAGSGKTRALSHRFAYLVNELGILPGNILCVTFTNKAANEMRQRIHTLTGDNDTGYINTFHGFCVSVLQEDSAVIQYPKSFLVLDNSDINAMLQIIYEERGLTLREMTFGKARDMIEIRKLFKNPDYYLDMLSMSLDGLKQKYLDAVKPEDIIFYGYLYQEKKCFGLDYNDLILFSLHIFRQHEDIRLKWQQRLEYIMIDEFQDIDSLQYELMEVLCGYHKNLFVVGDPDQTIYTWRGADVKYLLEFDQNFPHVRTVMMLENYRSTPEILAAANSLIEKNQVRMEKALLPTLPSGAPILCHYAKTQEEETEWMAEEIQHLHEGGTAYGDIAIFYRDHHVTRTIEGVFLQKKLPYAIYSGTQFFDRMEVKDALSYLRMIAYQDDLSFLRVANRPKRNIGKKRIDFLQSYAAREGCSLYQALLQNLEEPVFKGTRAQAFASLVQIFSLSYARRPVSEVLADVLDQSGYEEALRTEGNQERLDNLAELKQSVYEYETTCGEESTLEDYLAHVALFTNSDSEEKKDRVKLMTVHSAKGLEFPFVFICELNEGVFPSRKVRTQPGMEEERRLAYVALTRAEKGLYLSEAGGRNHDSSLRYPSRFLLDIDQSLLTFTHAPKEGLLKETRDYIELAQKYMPEDDNDMFFQEGERVTHAAFGPGTILSVDADKGAHPVQFDSMSTPCRISFRAKLERLSE